MICYFYTLVIIGFETVSERILACENARQLQKIWILKFKYSLTNTKIKRFLKQKGLQNLICISKILLYF